MTTSTKPTSNSADDCLQAIARGLSSPRLPQQGPVMDQTLQHSAASPGPKTEPLRWHPPCDHPAMAVLYRENFRCSSCGRQSPFGWLYRCVADTDPLLLGARDKGDPVAFDDIGRQFADQMSLGKFGPDRRSKEDSILDELSPEQFCSYTPEQLDTLLSQRENVRKVTADSRGLVGSHTGSSTEMESPHNDRQWIPNRQDECQHKICHACNKVGRDKSWVSLNAVLNGDIMPTVATGFSFRYMGTRPVVDADVLKNIGRRAPQPPEKRPARPPLRRRAAQPTLCAASTSASSVSAIGTLPPAPQHAVSEGSTPPAVPDDQPVAKGTDALVAATPRSVPSDAPVEISVAEFIFDYGCDEYTLACCTALPVAGPEEEFALGEAGQAGVEVGTAVVASTSCSMLAGLN